jgi:hypothetical protein
MIINYIHYVPECVCVCVSVHTVSKIKHRGALIKEYFSNTCIIQGSQIFVTKIQYSLLHRLSHITGRGELAEV